MLIIQILQKLVINLFLPIDPTQVFKILIRFNGVYTEVYRIKFAAPSAAVKPLTPSANVVTPAMPETTAKPMA